MRSRCLRTFRVFRNAVTYDGQPPGAAFGLSTNRSRYSSTCNCAVFWVGATLPTAPVTTGFTPVDCQVTSHCTLAPTVHAPEPPVRSAVDFHRKA